MSSQHDPFRIQEGRFGRGYLKDFTANQEAGDTLVSGTAGNFLGKSLSRRAIIAFFTLFLLVFSTVFSRAFYLQVYAGNKFEALAEGNRTKRLVLAAPRGIIYDAKNRPLVYNTWNFSLYIDRRELTEATSADFLRKTVSEVSPEIDLDKALATKGPDPVLLAEQLSYDNALKLLALSRFHKELVVAYEPGRSYPIDAGLSHVIGYTGLISPDALERFEEEGYSNNDVIGKSGIEYQYEKYLRGKHGFEDTEVDALGREYQKTRIQNPIQGADLTVTLDMDVQKALYNALSQVANESQRKKIAGVVLDPKTGGALAMVSLPDFDSNIFSHRLSKQEFDAVINDENRPLYNRAISGEYPAGSTFKIIMASAGLQEGVVTENTTVLSTGGINVNGFSFPDWRPGGHGPTNIYHALADSVNTYFYLLGGGDNAQKSGLGLDRIRTYAEKFGLSSVLGIDLPGESSGFVPTAAWKEKAKGERWYLGDTYNLSIGQGDLTVTPLQMAHAVSIIASNGLQTTPHLLKRVSDFDSLKEPAVSKIAWLSNDTIAIVRKGLRETVLNGSATSLQAVAVPVAGKTGTAQFNRNKEPHSWFAGFAPYDDPEFAFAIIVEEGGDQGLAVRASRIFLQNYFNNKQNVNE